MARFHDESYINRYMLDKKPKVLNDGYALQHIWPYHGPHKAVVRNKEEVLGIHVLGRLKEVYTDTSLSFLLDEHLCFRPGGIVNLYGGLGNQMFGYAFCLYMQKKDSQRHWWIDAYACQNSNVHNGYELNKIFIGINASSELSEESHQKLSQVSDKYKTNIKELHLSQVQTFISSDKSLVIYNGCWQCYPYVEACADELRQQFQFDETQLNEKNKKILAYDGTYVTDFNYHSIDSIVQDAKKVAKESVNMLIKLINDQPLKKREVLVPVKYKKGDTL